MWGKNKINSFMLLRIITRATQVFSCQIYQKTEKMDIFLNSYTGKWKNSYKSNIRMKRRAINALPNDLDAQIF